MIDVRRYLLIFLTAAFITALVMYGFFQFRGYRRGPVVIIQEPPDGALLANPFMTITGIAKNVSRLELNERAIFTGEDGSFSESLLMPPGYSILLITATDKFGRVKRLEHRVIAPPHSSTNHGTNDQESSRSGTR